MLTAKYQSYVIEELQLKAPRILIENNSLSKYRVSLPYLLPSAVLSFSEESRIPPQTSP